MRAGTRPKCFHICFTNLQTNLCLYFIVFQQCTLSTASGSYDLSRQSLQSSSLDRIESYEITYPRWISLDRHKRSSDTGQAPKQLPSEMEVLITAEGQQLKLHLERNEQLLAPGYQEIWYSPSGSRLTSSPNNTGHCYFHGVVWGVEGSSVALSTCSGLRGLISLNTSVSYLIEPLPGAADTQQPHAVFRAENLRLPKGTCLHHHGNQAQEDGLDSFISGMMAPHGRRERRDVSQSMKYVELLLVADRAEFQKHGGDLEKTKMHLLETANHVDKYYRALSIRVAVIGLEIWSDGDKIDVSDNPYSTLGDFLTWRRKKLHTLPNDNAQLITGVSFQGTTIGLAPLKAMCSDYQSGGVNSDHSGTAVGVAATMAHEMGHNFGMSHDNGECCQARPEDGGCIMAAATGHPYPRVFNPCNQRELNRYLTSGGGKCLFNLPNTRAMYGGQRCGNGYLEDGEECDCGDEEECTSPCCNANNCTLKAGAECAHGVCCHDCKLKSPGVLCRAPSGSCDLPEYCDGKAESCPANFYLADGTSCAGGRAYCYTGMCLTLEQQCQSLWGPDARSAPDLCFQEVNKAGDQYGNCGKDQLGKYKRCMGRNATCGKIQCVSSASKPIGTNAVTIDTTVSLGNKRVLCRGTHVYQVGKTDEDQGGDTLDPGLVMAGTKCGDDSVCFGGQCRNASFLRADECHAKCHSRGLCNNNQQCHCDPGWAPPLCDQVGSGGSMDSGPVIKHNSLLPVLLLLPLVVLVLLAAVGLWCCYRHKFRPLKNAGPSPTPVCPVPTAAKPVHANPLSNGNINGHAGIHANCHSSAYASGHANPTFMVTRQDSDRLGQPSPRSSPSCPPRPRHSFTRPTGKPPSIPAYAAQRREGQNPFQTQASAQPQPPPKPQHFATPHSPSPAVKPQQRPAQPPLPSAPPGAACLGSNSNHSPRAEPKLRPDPPNRPPPPCPIAKPPQDKLPPKSQVRLTIDALQRGKTSLALSTGHIQQCRPQVKISGKT